MSFLGGVQRGSLSALLVLTGACALPRAPTVPVEEARKVARGLASDAPPEGQLRPGDLMVVTITHGADLPREIVGSIDARGMLHIGGGSDVAIGGLPLQQAEDKVAQAVHRRDRLVQVDLRISERRSQRVSVLGALARPGYLDLGKGMRVTDLVAAAGGLRNVIEGRGNEGESSIVPIADLADGALIRDGRALPIDLEAALRGTPKHNVYVHPGDQLYVPFATDQVVSVIGQVTLPGAFVHRKGLRLSEALSAAGGITVGGDKGDIRVVRGAADAPTAYKASLSALTKQKGRDVALAAGDVVFVTDDPLEDLGEVVVGLIGPVAAIALSVVTAALVVQSLEQQRNARTIAGQQAVQ